jgi:hypothetical protein
MVHGVGGVSRIVVIVIIVVINNHRAIAMIPIATVVRITGVTIYANRHDGERGKIGWRIPIVIGWYIWHIDRRIHILYDRGLFYHDRCG